MVELRLLNHLTRALVYLETAFWIGFGGASVLGLIPGLPEEQFIRWGMAGLSVIAGGALLILFTLSQRSRLAYYALIGLLILIAILSIADQVGLLDWLSLVLNLGLLSLIILTRKQAQSCPGENDQKSASNQQADLPGEES